MSVQVDVLGTAADTAERLSLVIEPVAPYELAEVIAEAYGLTGREREVAGLVVASNSNPEVAPPCRSR
jgi:ATP/maltotriose-dependent transcriptional regulator MalT